MEAPMLRSVKMLMQHDAAWCSSAIQSLHGAEMCWVRPSDVRPACLFSSTRVAVSAKRSAARSSLMRSRPLHFGCSASCHGQRQLWLPIWMSIDINIMSTNRTSCSTITNSALHRTFFMQCPQQTVLSTAAAMPLVQTGSRTLFFPFKHEILKPANQTAARSHWNQPNQTCSLQATVNNEGQTLGHE